MSKLNVIEGNRDDLELQLLEAIFFDRDRIPELERKLTPSPKDRLTIVSNSAANELAPAQITPVP